MSYNLAMPCGCVVYVSCFPDTGLAHTRIIETRAASCRMRGHEQGTRVYLWDLLPAPELSAWATASELRD